MAQSVVHRPSTDPVPLDDLVDAVLASSRALVAAAARSLAGTRGGTLPQFRLFVVLADGPSNLRKLASALDVGDSTATRMVDHLVTAGLVDRSVEPDDRRTTRLALTTAGRRTVRTVVARRRRHLTAVLEAVPADGRAGVAAAMATFAAPAEQVLGHRAVTGP